VLINIRNNYFSKLLVVNISLLLLVQEFAYSQVGSSKVVQNADTNTFNKVEIADTKPFKPGDGLFIDTFPDTSSFLNNIFSIDDMGYVDFPIAGRAQVSSMTNDELKDFIIKNFQQYIRTPNVTVKPMMRISLIGGFSTPGFYYVDPSKSMWDAVRLGGGLPLESGLEEMVWCRDGDEVVDNIVPYFEKGISLKNMGFKSGDQLVTPTMAPMNWRETTQFVMSLATFVTGILITYLTFQTQLRIMQQ